MSQAALEATWDETGYSERLAVCKMFNDGPELFADYMATGVSDDISWEELTRDHMREIAMDFFEDACR